MTKYGIEQAIEPGKQLPHIHFDSIVVSPLAQTCETFDYAKQKFRKMIISELCREYKTDPCDFMHNEIHQYETSEELEKKVNLFLTWLKQRQEKCIAIISHADFINEIANKWLANAEYFVMNEFPKKNRLIF